MCKHSLGELMMAAALRLAMPPTEVGASVDVTVGFSSN